MGTFTALLLATPIFGFALSPPPASLSAPAAGSPVLAQLAPAESDGGASIDPDKVELPPEPKLQGPGSPNYLKDLRKRARLAKVHRTLGISTWAAMAVTVIAGTIQYRNLYGKPFTTGLSDTPCVTGHAAISQNQCSGQPWFHELSAYVTTGLYFSTLGLAMAMPDPDHASKGTSKYAKTVRTHKALRWVHLAGMVTQIVLGIIIANPRLGLDDRANNYGATKALAGFHLATGYITLGALSWAGTIMLL